MLKALLKVCYFIVSVYIIAMGALKALYGLHCWAEDIQGGPSPSFWFFIVVSFAGLLIFSLNKPSYEERKKFEKKFGWNCDTYLDIFVEEIFYKFSKKEKQDD